MCLLNENTGGPSSSPPRSPDLPPSDFIFFGTLKDASRMKEFGSDDRIVEEVVQEGDSCPCFSLVQGY
jgi:hypothetical protein